MELYQSAIEGFSEMNVLILSHSYFAQENQKNIISLSSFCRVKCVLPKQWDAPFGHGGAFQATQNKELFVPLKSVIVFRSQYIFTSISLGVLHFRPDIINVEYNPWSLMFFLALLYKVLFSRHSKIVCTIKKNTFIKRPGFWGRLRFFIASLSLRMTDHIIAVSGMAQDLLTSKFAIPPWKISLCQHLGVDTEIFKPAPIDVINRKDAQKSIVIGYCGRLAKHKGIEDLIEAVHRVRKGNRVHVTLKLLGEEYPESWLIPYSAPHTWVEILPAVSLTEVADFLRELDIFVLPSRNLPDHQEHDAHALLEALATGLPCVGTKSGIIPEILGDGTGCLVGPENPEELAKVLEKLILNPEYRNELAVRSRQKAIKEFALDALTSKKVDIFKGF